MTTLKVDLGIVVRSLLAKNQEITIGVKGSALEIKAPYLDKGLKKTDIIKWAHENGLPIENMWSCWHDGEHQCGDPEGKCDPCKKRKEAYDELGMKDPTEYLDPSGLKYSKVTWG